MRKILSFILLCIISIHLVESKSLTDTHAGSVYYVDSENGSDANSGLTKKQAWKSIDRVNDAEFKPGDKILFKSGCRWTGQLRPKGSGVEGQPICIGNYGRGPLPYISQGEKSGYVLMLRDQEYWEIRNLEIDGGTSKPNEAVGGIHVQAVKSSKVLKHIVIENCTVRNNWGSIKLYESCAIWVGIPGWNDSIGLKTGFSDVLIQNNHIYGSDRNGILVWTTAGTGPKSQFTPGLIQSRNVVVRNNNIEDIGGDAIIILGSNGALVEKNTVRRCCLKTGDPKYGRDYNPSSAAIWLHHCDNSIMQFNSVYDCKKHEYNNDGMAFDFDFNCKNNILQYNYSCNNEGGFLLIMQTASDNVARYNISHNDRNHVLFCVGDKNENNVIHNNTFYINDGTSFIVPNATFANNIFMTGPNSEMSVQNQERGIFKNNCYYGNWKALPDDKSAITENPLLKNPENSKCHIKHLSAYKLLKKSPCIDKGIEIENHGFRDISGKRVPKGNGIDIGAMER